MQSENDGEEDQKGERVKRHWRRMIPAAITDHQHSWTTW